MDIGFCIIDREVLRLRVSLCERKRLNTIVRWLQRLMTQQHRFPNPRKPAWRGRASPHLSDFTDIAPKCRVGRVQPSMVLQRSTCSRLTKRKTPSVSSGCKPSEDPRRRSAAKRKLLRAWIVGQSRPGCLNTELQHAALCLIYRAHALKSKIRRPSKDDIAAAVHCVRLHVALVDQA